MFHTGVRDEHLQCSLTLQSLLSIEISLVCKTNLLLLVAGLFAYVWKEGIVSKYRSKICIKSNQEGEWNSLKIMNRSTPQQTQDYEISVFAQLKTWIISHVEECFYADKLCTDTLLLIGFTTNCDTMFWKSLSVMLLASWKQLKFLPIYDLFTLRPLASYIKSKINLNEY